MALGANVQQIVRLVLMQSVRLRSSVSRSVLRGAFAMSRLLQATLFGVQ